MLKFFPLVWAQLWRKKTRTVLTLLSLVTAFLLLGLLQAANSMFSNGIKSLDAPILMTQARVSFTSPLPLRLMTQLESVPGVEAVSHSQFFGGIYQDPKQRTIQFVVNPDRWLQVYPECVLPPDQELAWKTTRTGMIAGRDVAERLGWKVGDKIPLISQIWPQKNGSRAWEFDLVGIFDHRSAESCIRGELTYINYDYFDEARQFGKGMAGIFVLRLANADDAPRIAPQIDAMFENSQDETKTQTEKEFALNMAKQMGNLSLILNLILVAVFFSILMLTGNTMTQAVRERIPELAVLKTLGFTDTAVLLLVLSESLLLCVLGGLTGMLLANGVMVGLQHAPIPFPPMKADAAIWAYAVAAMLTLAAVIGVVPALRAKRLSIVDALAGR